MEVLTPSKSAQNGRGGAVTQRRILEFLASKKLEDKPHATIRPTTQDYVGGERRISVEGGNLEEGDIQIEVGRKEDIKVSRGNTLSLVKDIRLTNTKDKNTALTTPSTGRFPKYTARDSSPSPRQCPDMNSTTLDNRWQEDSV